MTQYGDFFKCDTEEEVTRALVHAANHVSLTIRKLKLSPLKLDKVELIIREAPETYDYNYSVAWKFNVEDDKK